MFYNVCWTNSWKLLPAENSCRDYTEDWRDLRCTENLEHAEGLESIPLPISRPPSLAPSWMPLLISSPPSRCLSLPSRMPLSSHPSRKPLLISSSPPSRCLSLPLPPGCHCWSLPLPLRLEEPVERLLRLEEPWSGRGVRWTYVHSKHLLDATADLFEEIFLLLFNHIHCKEE